MLTKALYSGRIHYHFQDLNNIDCTIADSSYMREDAIYLGADIHKMHLNKRQAEKLIEKLQEFVEKGKLS
jgi:hypothetical protein